MIRRTDDLDYIANQLDSKFKGPFGFRFGWDGLLGLIPGAGDLVTSSFAFYIIVRAAAAGVAPSILARMGLNVLIDNVFDKIPILGWFFDFFWKSNLKNVALLKQAALDHRKTTWQSRIWVVVILLVILALFILTVIAGFMLLRFIFEFLQTQFAVSSSSY